MAARARGAVRHRVREVAAVPLPAASMEATGYGGGGEELERLVEASMRRNDCKRSIELPSTGRGEPAAPGAGEQFGWKSMDRPEASRRQRGCCRADGDRRGERRVVGHDAGGRMSGGEDSTESPRANGWARRVR